MGNYSFNPDGTINNLNFGDSNIPPAKDNKPKKKGNGKTWLVVLVSVIVVGGIVALGIAAYIYNADRGIEKWSDSDSFGAVEYAEPAEEVIEVPEEAAEEVPEEAAEEVPEEVIGKPANTNQSSQTGESTYSNPPSEYNEPFLTLSTDIIYVPAEGGTYNISVISNVYWYQARPLKDWVAVQTWGAADYNGNDNDFSGTIQITVEPNYGEARTEYPMIRYEYTHKDIIICQAAYQY